MVVSLARYDDGNVRVVLDRARRVGPHEWESIGLLSFKDGSGEPAEAWSARQKQSLGELLLVDLRSMHQVASREQANPERPLRSFVRKGDTVVDVYGARVSFEGSTDFFSKLRWHRKTPSTATAPFPRAARARELAALRKRLRTGTLASFTDEDLRNAARFGDPAAARLVEARLGKMSVAWRTKHRSRLAQAAAAVLSCDPSHTRAATILASLLGDARASAFERTLVAAIVAGIFSANRDTEAMRTLETALHRLVGEGDGCWGPWAYTCIAQVMRIDRQLTLAWCARDLAHEEEWNRHLLLDELAEVPGADVLALLRRHLDVEPSLRLKIRIARALGDLLPERVRLRILARALCDPSPSCRFLAIKSLQHVPLAAAKALAKRSLAVEPDPLLVDLLQQVLALRAAR